MSDFIFSSNNIPHGSLTKKIQSIYCKDPPHVIEYHGLWGSLAVSSSMYQGFGPLETDDHICFIIGGPVLTFTENSFLTGNDSTAATKQIFERLKDGVELQWDEDLSGPFIVFLLNKKNHTIQAVTDLMAFIPLYETDCNGLKVIGTHVDVVAKVAHPEIRYDTVSLADFFLNGIVTYPYTIYETVHQLAPASIHNWTLFPEIRYKKHIYWQPHEKNPYQSINHAADALRDALSEYIQAITVGMNNVAIFLSGGEDSRTILSFLPNRCERNAFIFLDGMNREGKTAQKAAIKYGAHFQMIERNPTHYLEILTSCSDLVGSGFQFFHVPSFELHNSCGLTQYSAVFGGFFSDALLKGYRIKKYVITNLLPFIPKIKKPGHSSAKSLKLNIFKPNIIEMLNQRHRVHYNRIKAIRPKSSDEWFHLWPCSMNSSIPNIHGNRRLFRSYEPFLASKVVKIAAACPQNWKLNRRLFQHMAKPQLEPAKHIPHADGWMPYYPWYINFIIHSINWTSRGIQKKIGLIKGNQGPWFDIQTLMSSTIWRNLIDTYTTHSEKNQLMQNLLVTDIKELLLGEKIDSIQKLNMIQIFYTLHAQDFKTNQAQSDDQTESSCF